MCDTAIIKETIKQSIEFDYSDLQSALRRYIKRTEDTIKKAFDNAFRLPNIDDSIRVLASQDQDGAQIDELLLWAQDVGIKTTKKKLESDLKKLESERYGELVKYSHDSWRFSFSNPFYRTFALAYFESQDEKIRRLRKGSHEDMMKIMDIAFKTFKNNLAPDEE